MTSPPTSEPTPGDDALAAAVARSTEGSWSALRAFVQRTESALARTALRYAASSETDRYARSQEAMLLAVNPAATDSDLDQARELLAEPLTDVSEPGVETGVREAWSAVAQALLRAGRDHEVVEILDELDLGPHLTWTLRTDLVNPTRIGDRSDAAVARFLDSFNVLFSTDDLEPIVLQPPAGQADADFLGLRALPASTVPGEDLITVVMSAFRPGEEMRTAVRSICDQSWQAWELLIVDDASGPDFSALLEDVAASDGRIRLLRSDDNRGTYAARNLAFRHAQGRYLTFQDSDDWSHPRRLERQVRLLQDRPRLLADRSWALRAYRDLTLTYPGYPANRVNASSLMMDREQVHDLLGAFDRVRMSADVEYPARLTAARPLSLKDEPGMGHLAITMLRSGSLSRADSRPGWLHWTRTAYRDAFRAWHAQIRAGRVSPRLTGSGTRPFPLPDHSFETDRTQPRAPGPELVLLGDLRADGPRASAAAELARLLGSRRRIGLAHAETPSPLAERRQPTHPAAQALLQAARASRMHLSRDDRIPLLVVTDPAALLHADGVSASVDKALLIGQGWRSDPTWSVDAVAARVARLWSIEPIWAVTNADDRDRFAAAHPTATLWDEPLPWAVDPEALRLARSHRRDGFVVVGNHLPDRPEHWQVTRSQLTAALPADDRRLDVRVLTGHDTVAEILGRDPLPAGWVDLHRSGTTVLEFLGQLDVFVGLGVWDDETEIAVLQALAADLPVLLTAAASALPDDLRGLVRLESAEDLGRAAIAAVGADPVDAQAALSARAGRWLSVTDRLLDDPSL